MVKITLIMPVGNCDTFLEQSIRSILNQSFDDFELLCVDDNSTDNSLKILNYHSANDQRVKIYKNHDNLMTLLNNLLYQANGKYILFLDSINILKENILEEIYKKTLKTTTDLLLFKPDNITKKQEESYNYLSKTASYKIFNSETIRNVLFDLYDSPHHFLFNKNVMTKNGLSLNSNPYDYEIFFYKLLQKSDRIIYINQNIYKTHYKYDDDLSFNEYLKTQNDIQNLFYEENFFNQANNNKITKTIICFEKSNIYVKKEVFQSIRDDYINMLDFDNINEFVDSLTQENRKRFEQIIISETLEEYELLKKVYEDKNDINFMKRYEYILKTEQQKIKNFNNSLVSSNSWKLTKIFRLIK